MSKKKELIAKLRQKKQEQKLVQTTLNIPAYSRVQPIPTSVIQKEIWFHEHLVSNSNAYNIPIALELHGELNYAALVQAFRIVIQRYEILRTSFYTIEGVPYQKIHSPSPFKLNVINLEDFSPAEQEKRVVDILYIFSKKSFPLDHAPLFRVLSLELGSNKYVLSFVIHHILCDNWSLTLLIQEILSLYNQLSEGKYQPVTQPSYHYADFAFWEQAMLASDETKVLMERLKQRLRGLNFELKLPYDFPRNFTERAEAKSKQFILDPSCSKQVGLICTKNHMTPYVFFLTVYHVLIFKYSFQNKIVIGTSFLNRPAEEQEGVMGPYINVALIDSQINLKSTFIDLAHQIKTTVLEMHAYRFIPLNKMIMSMNSQVRKELSLTQIFYGYLNFKLNQVSDSSSNQKMTVKLLNQSNELRVYNSAKFELDLTMWEDESNMGGSLEYMSNIFKDESIDLLIDHYKHLCKQFCAQPSLTIAETHLPGYASAKLLNDEEAAFNFG